MRPIPETAKSEVERLQKFQDETFRILDHYVSHYVSPKEFGAFRELRKDLWKLKTELFENRNER